MTGSCFSFYRTIVCLVIIITTGFVAKAQVKDYSLAKVIPVGDESGWDYVAIDQVHRNAFFSHATKVLVLSVASDSIIAEIPNTYGVHGIAFDYALNRGFISNGKGNSVSVISLVDFKVLDTLPVNGVNPDAILFDKYSNKVFVFNGKSNNVSVIDPVNLQVISSIPLPGKPEFSVSNQAGQVFVNIEDRNEVVVIDSKNLQVQKVWSLSPGDSPTGLAIDLDRGLLFSSCSNKRLMVFDIRKEKVVDSIVIGGRVDAVVYSPETHTVFTSNGEGTVSIFHESDKGVLTPFQTLVTKKGSKTMAFDPVSKKIYLPAALFEGDTKKLLPGSFEIRVYQ